MFGVLNLGHITIHQTWEIILKGIDVESNRKKPKKKKLALQDYMIK